MVDSNNGWDFKDAEQRRALLEEVTAGNCGEKLKLVQQVAMISRRELAKVLGVSEATVRRLENTDTEPTTEFMSRLHALCVIGRARFGNMSDGDREKVSEVIGAGGGVVAGVGGSIAAVSAGGSVAGLSAAGITSGLAAVGGGTMLAGIGVVAAIPVAFGLAGYGFVKAIKAIADANNLETQEVDGRWEIRRATHQL